MGGFQPILSNSPRGTDGHPKGKWTMSDILRVENITQLHEAMGCGKPKHPLITVIRNRDAVIPEFALGCRVSTSFYAIHLKVRCPFVLKYGRGYYDFQEGTMTFMAPEQVIQIEAGDQGAGEAPAALTDEGWGLFFHPDLIRKTALGEAIHDYGFFSYETHEALHLSDEEKATINGIVDQIEAEAGQNLDVHSNDLIVSNLDLLLKYVKRFYGRQFITRSAQNQDMVARFERLMEDYFRSGTQLTQGVPTVKSCADQLGLSPDYLSDLLRQETGKSTIDHIHHALIERAKTRLLGSSASISEIAFDLGFEYPQYFSKMFKAKTGMTPGEYRRDH